MNLIELDKKAFLLVQNGLDLVTIELSTLVGSLVLQ